MKMRYTLSDIDLIAPTIRQLNRTGNLTASETDKPFSRPFVVTPEEWRDWRRLVLQNYALITIISFCAGVATALWMG